MVPQKVTEKILEDAKKEAAEILAKHQNEASDITHDYEDRIARKKKQIEQEIEEKKKTEIMRALSQHRLELSKKLTEHKQQLIKATIDHAVKQLIEREEYLDFIKALIEKSGEKNGALLLSKNDMKRYGGEVEKFADKNELKFRITSDDKMRGGIILSKEKTRYIGSLDIILELLNDELAIVVSKELFKIQSKGKKA
jgi:V/A-type H+-transporting ATPase subunit E